MRLASPKNTVGTLHATSLLSAINQNYVPGRINTGKNQV